MWCKFSWIFNHWYCSSKRKTWIKFLKYKTFHVLISWDNFILIEEHVFFFWFFLDALMKEFVSTDLKYILPVHVILPRFWTRPNINIDLSEESTKQDNYEVLRQTFMEVVQSKFHNFFYIHTDASLRTDNYHFGSRGPNTRPKFSISNPIFVYI